MNSFFCNFLFTVFFLVWNESRCYSQILIIDSVNKESVPYVEIFTEEGIYLGNADEKGIISLRILEKIMQSKESTVLVFNQMAYKKLTIQSKDIANLKAISLQPKEIELNEVVISPLNSAAILVLTGYYRSYQLKNGQLEYFSDGKIELAYGPNESKGLNKRLSERTWFNPNIKSESNIIINMVGPPVPDFNTIVKIKEDKKKSIYTLLQSNKNKNLTIVEVLKNDFENVKTIKALGNKSIINFHKEKFGFATSHSENLNANYLDYYSINKSLKFKCKDCDVFQDYFMQSEVFITNVQYYDTFSKKEYSKFTGYPRYSHFEKDYWSDAEKHSLFQPLNKNIKTELLKLTLKPLKQTNE